MKTATAKVIDLAGQFVIKYAKKNNKKTNKCTCEQDSCKLMGAHEPGRCKNNSSGKASMYLGPICDECAQFLDTQYLIDFVE
jgi:hypothetical protein